LPTTGVPDRCPGVLRLHPAQDGGLARVRLPGGRIDADGLDAVAAVAERTGGAIECSSRASLQLRGLRSDDADACAERLFDAGLLPSVSHERVRNILASPLGGRHPRALLQTDELVAALDRRLCGEPALAALPGRFLFAVDDGSGTLDTRRADATVIPDPAGTLWLRVGDLETDLHAAADGAAGLLTATAHAFLALGGDAHGIRALADGGRELVHGMGGDVLGPAHRGGGQLAPGIAAQRDGRRAVTATVPLARLEPGGCRGLAALAREHRTDARLSTGRTITLVDIEPSAVTAVGARLERIGLIAGESGWQGLTACAGRGACAQALADVRAGARARAIRRRPGDPREHWSGCPRRCGHPSGDAVSVTAEATDELRVTGDAAAVTSIRGAVDGLGAIRVVGR
jgi:precorrin-3B synthase